MDEDIYDQSDIIVDGNEDGLDDDIDQQIEVDLEEDLVGEEQAEEAIGEGEGEGVGETDEFDAEEQLDDGTDDITQYGEILKDAQSLAKSESVYKTGKFLYKYEYPRIISARATAIQNGAPPLIHLIDPVTGRQLRDPVEIAEEELKQGKLPLMVDRPLPGKAPYKQLIEQRPLATLIF